MSYVRRLRKFAGSVNTDKITTIHDYVRMYESLFSLPNQSFGTILEIGVHKGESLKLWSRVFPESKIYGIDINPRCLRYARENVEIHLVDQSDRSALREFADKHGPFDMIIDDGSHYMSHQINAWKSLWRYLNPRGLYVIEDVLTSYWTKYQDSYPTCVEFFRGMIDEVNFHGDDKDEKMEFTGGEIFNLQFKSNMIVMQKQ
jgi:predicted O-methyltransferase YrrM